jgi:hypothetical protein
MKAEIWVAGVLVWMGLAAFGQSTLPPTSPTAAAPPQPVGTKAVEMPVHRATVVYAKGQLEVTADGSSLNQILRDVSRQSGMKITGGVADQRVYGKYGPAPASDVLADLLGGTDSNMMLLETAAKDPAELILSPRGGGPTPPNPNAARDEAEAAPVMNQPPVQESTQPAMPGNPATGPGPASGNAAKTPLQVYQELQQMQRTKPQ